MQNIRKILRNIIVAVIVSLQVGFYPVVAFAVEVEASETTTQETAADPVDSTQSIESASVEQPPAETLATGATGPQEPTGPTEPVGPQEPTGPQQPNGAASSTYHENPDGTWENDLYIWDPVTQQTRPKTPQTYSFNPTTQLWDTTEWYYSPETGRYEPNTISVAQNPNHITALGVGNQGLITSTGPGSNNAIDFGGTTTGTFDLFFNASVSNRIGQMTRSGDASVQGNTLGGSALTGDAQSIANILNLLQSSWGTLGSDDIATFVANVDGDVVGDLYIDPSLIPVGNGNSDIDINVAQNGQINNDVDVASESGNAGVTGNTTGGSATSGRADAVVNLLNLINSAISSKKSFVGVLNINGNLEGDILLPPGMLNTIIASTGPSSNNQISGQDNDSLDVSVDRNNRINNDVVTDATTGNATVANNTSGGSATTGRANNNITLLNLTGKKVVAKNAVLVFVNVLGKWVGLIMDAPAGSYAVAATGPNSNNTINADNNQDVDIGISENNEINNNVNVAAHSGDATVDNNTSGGDAQSGDASASVNILNLIDSTFDVSDWFGVLFINVFGSWDGSFGVDTAAGNRPRGGGEPSMTQTEAPAPSAPPQVFGFIPKPPSVSNTTTYQTASYAVANGTQQQVVASNQPNSAVLTTASSNTPAETINDASRNSWVPPFVFAVGMVVLGAERFLSIRRRP